MKITDIKLSDFSSRSWADIVPAEQSRIELAAALRLGMTNPTAAQLAEIRQHMAAQTVASASVTPAFERRMSMGELRVDPVTRQLVGYAVVFNKLSEDLGFMREIIAPEAVDRALREGQDVRALFNHDPNFVLGRTKAGTLRLKKDSYGLKVEVDPPKTTAGRDVVELVNRGDVSGQSFAFQTLDENWDLKQNPPVRTVLDMNMRDISIVTYPAYPQTDVALRSLDEVVKRSGAVPADLDRYLKLKGVV